MKKKWINRNNSRERERGLPGLESQIDEIELHLMELIGKLI